MADTAHRTNGGIGRREMLRTAAGAAGALGATGAVAAQDDEIDYGGWFDDTDNFDGTQDATGQDEVVVEVGVEANGGPFGFGPAAVRVDAGTTVVWEWTGEGGMHNVVATDDTFASELMQEAGATFEHTVEEEGIYRYICEPHESVGMKGAVAVGDASGVESGSGGSDVLPVGLVGGSLLLAFLSPLFFALFLFLRRDRRQES